MEKTNNKNKNKRTTEDVLVSFFPDIDRKALKEVLKDDPSPNMSPSRKRKSINDEALIESAKKSMNNNYTTFYTENENEKLDKMFSEKENREKKYLRNVKKAVTTVALPNPLSKGMGFTEMPSFLTKNIKKVHKITGAPGNYTTNRLRVSALKKDDIIFALFVTGSEDTDYCFKLLTKNFSNLSENHKSVFIYIVPNLTSDMTYNFKNKKENIINKYSIEMRNLDVDRFFFSTQPSQPKEYPSEMSQYYKHCCTFPFKFSLFGFSGLKGPKGDKKELDKNLKFLMKYHKQPFIISKCDLYEEKNKDSVINLTNEESKSYSWLFVFDRINVNCFKCYNSFEGLIDFSKDKISALTLLSSHMTEDDIRPKFEKEMKEKDVKFSYYSENYTSEASAIVKKKVNFESEHYDFVVIYNSYNNSEVNKGNYEKQNASNYQIISECLSNICVTNGI